MTSSLVGSEMCIRDRLCAVLGTMVRRWFGCWSVEGWLGWARQVGGKGPVSYTHLTLPTICSV
eukprot:545930-Prorocentrum_lima.AAC.1